MKKIILVQLFMLSGLFLMDTTAQTKRFDQLVIGELNPRDLPAAIQLWLDGVNISLNDKRQSPDESIWFVSAQNGTFSITTQNADCTQSKSPFIIKRGTGIDVDVVSFPEGKIGIGTDDPKAKLHVKGSGVLSKKLTLTNINQKINNSPWYGLGKSNRQNLSANGQSKAVQLAGMDGLLLKTEEGELAIHQNGSVGIGTEPAMNYTLAIGGKAIAEEIKVRPQNEWPDYVFEEDYDLRSLEELASYIKVNKHLPEVPSAKEVNKQGIFLGEMDAQLLKKIEELTLHLLVKDEEIKTLATRNKQIEQRLQRLEAVLLGK